MGGKDHNTKAEPGFIKRRNRISGQFSPRLVEMLESPAWRALSLSAHRVIDRISIELAHHGGNDNGQLPVTKQDFIDYGISGNQVAPAIREAEALGFIRVTEHGRGGNSEYRQPSKFFLTFAHSRTSRDEPPTHDWRKIKTIEEAEAIAAAAREAKNPTAVMSGHRSWALRKTRNRYQNLIPGPVLETNTETPQSPVLETNTTGSGRKPIPLSISRGGGRGLEAVVCSKPKAGLAGADDGRHTRENLMTYVANVIDEQLHDLDRPRVAARRQAQWRIRQQCPFDPPIKTNVRPRLGQDDPF